MMRFKNPVPKVERERRKELEAKVEALVKKTKLTKAEIKKERVRLK